MESVFDVVDWKFVTSLKVVFSQLSSLNLVWNNVYRVRKEHISIRNGSGLKKIKFSTRKEIAHSKK